MSVTYLISQEKVNDLINKGKDTFSKDKKVLDSIERLHKIYLDHLAEHEGEFGRRISTDGFLSMYILLLVGVIKKIDGVKKDNSLWIINQIYMSGKPESVCES